MGSWGEVEPIDSRSKDSSASWCAHSFPRMRIGYTNGNTVLVGTVRDQAELTGFLQRFSDLGLSIVSVTMVDDPAGR